MQLVVALAIICHGFASNSNGMIHHISQTPLIRLQIEPAIGWSSRLFHAHPDIHLYVRNNTDIKDILANRPPMQEYWVALPRNKTAQVDAASRTAIGGPRNGLEIRNVMGVLS